MTLILQINCLGRDETQAMLHVASHHGQCEVLSYLLDKGADIEMKVLLSSSRDARWNTSLE